MDLLMISVNRKTAAGVLGLLLLLVAVAVAVQKPGQSDANAVRRHRVSAHVANQPGGPYAVLAEPRTAFDDIAKWRFERRADLGLRPAEAKVVDRNGIRTLAVVPSNGMPCFVEGYANGSTGVNCAGASGVVAAVSYSGSVGLVSDSVKTVTFTMIDGSTQTGSVSHNLWKAPLEAKSVTFTDHGDEHTVDLMPPSEMPAGTKVSAAGTVLMGTPPAGYGG